MAGFADLFYLGQPDPRRRIAELLAGQQQLQQGPQPGAGGPAPAPAGPAPAPGPDGAAPPPGPAPAAAPGPQNASDAANANAQGGGQAPNPAPGQQTPNAPPQPMAYQSSPDMSASYAQLANPPNLMSLYMQLDARNRASDQMNRGFALMASHWASPEGKRAIMESVGAAPDAGQQVGDIMKLYGAQQQMGAQGEMLKNADAYDQKLNLPPGTARDMILTGRGDELVKSLEPTDMARNYAWAHTTYAANHPGASPDEIDEGAQGILLGMGGVGGGDSATRSWRAAKIQWDQNQSTKGTPYPWGVGAEDNPTSFAAWQGGQKAEETKQAEDQSEAATKLPTYVQNLTGARKKVTDILGITGVDDQGHPIIDPTREALLKSVIGNPFAQSYINGEPGVGREFQGWWAGLNDQQKQVLTDIKEATDPNTLIGGIGKRAPKRGFADVNDITSGLSGMHDVTKNYGHWMQGALGTIGAIDTATGNAYGASGQPESAPENTKDLIDPTYLYGGKLYPKGKRPLPIPADQLANAQQQIQQAANPEEMRQNLITHFRARNFDPTPLKGQ